MKHKTAEPRRPHVDLKESSVYGPDAGDNAAAARGDIATDATLDRLEEITGGATEPALYRGALGRQVDQLEAASEEEVDALEVNLLQDHAVGSAADGSGPIADDVAREQLAEMTEVGRELADEGAESVVPGRDDTGRPLRRHHPDGEIALPESVVEGNLDEPRDEERSDIRADEGTAA